MGKLFRSDHPRSLRSDLPFNRRPEWIESMLHAPEVVREGGPPGFDREFGRRFFDYLEANRSTATSTTNSWSSPHGITRIGASRRSKRTASRFSHVCDVGGGRGHLLCHHLAAVPHLRGTVLDLPRVVADEDRRWADQLGVADRCAYVGGDMFEAVPEADTYLLKWILHNWEDEDCRRLLSTVREVAPADGRLFVIESVVPGPGTSHFMKRLDVTMMVQVGGGERAEAEYATLLDRAGWELVERRDTEDGELSVLEAAKA